MSFIKLRIVDNGDSGLTVFYDEPISEQLTRKIVGIEEHIRKFMGEHLLDVIPSYQSITIIFSLLKLSKIEASKKLQQVLRKPIEQTDSLPTQHYKLLEIPVCYCSTCGPDLFYLSKHCQLSEEQVVELHTRKEYLVHMLGFLPGFLYLGDLNPALFCPRKSEPRIRQPKGSVGIGGSQTGIYPIDSPGGWQIIGRTPTSLFNPNKEQPTLASPLDRIKFVAITHSKFLELEFDKKQAAKNS